MSTEASPMMKKFLELARVLREQRDRNYIAAETEALVLFLAERRELWKIHAQACGAFFHPISRLVLVTLGGNRVLKFNLHLGGHGTRVGDRRNHDESAGGRGLTGLKHAREDRRFETLVWFARKHTALNEFVTPVPISAKFLGPVSITLGVAGFVMLNRGVMVEAERDTIVQGVWPSIALGNDVMALDVDTFEPVTEAAATAARNQSLGFNFFLERHGVSHSANSLKRHPGSFFARRGAAIAAS